jgi:hypothetical protein
LIILYWLHIKTSNHFLFNRKELKYLMNILLALISYDLIIDIYQRTGYYEAKLESLSFGIGLPTGIYY